MKKLIFILFLFSVTTVFASQSNLSSSEDSMNVIHYQAQEQQWVSTKTAKLTVVVNASLSAKAMQALQKQIELNLDNLAKGASWRMIRYQRDQDASGLEQASVVEQTRLSLAQINHIQTKLASLNQAGVTYKVESIDYSPSQVELEKAKAQLRKKLYSQINQEIETLNEIYKSKFFIHDLQFYSDNNPQFPRPVASMGAPMAKVTLARVNSSEQQDGLFSQKVTVYADVTLASSTQPLSKD